MNESFHIGFRGISKRFGKTRVLEDSALSLRSSDGIVITGENGSGKTTLLRIIAGLEKPERCSVSFDGADSEPWRRVRKRLLKSVMYLHQQPYMLDGGTRRNLEYAAKLNPAIVDRDGAVRRALQWAGLERIAAQTASSLSGGQKQRVALARARLRGPQILLLDEPTANLDSDSRGRTLQMLSEFRDGGTAVVIVTHDPANFSRVASEHLHLEDQRIRPADKGASGVIDLDSRRQTREQ